MPEESREMGSLPHPGVRDFGQSISPLRAAGVGHKPQQSSHRFREPEDAYGFSRVVNPESFFLPEI
jgi:hypothetical protein